MNRLTLMFAFFGLYSKSNLHLSKVFIQLEYAIIVDEVILKREILADVMLGNEVAVASGHKVEFSQLFIHFYYSGFLAYIKLIKLHENIITTLGTK